MFPEPWPYVVPAAQALCMSPQGGAGSELSPWPATATLATWTPFTAECLSSLKSIRITARLESGVPEIQPPFVPNGLF